MKLILRVPKILKKKHPRLLFWILGIVVLLIIALPVFINQKVTNNDEGLQILEIPTLKELSSEKQSTNILPNKQIRIVADNLVINQGKFFSERINSIPKEVIEQAKHIFKDRISANTPQKLYILYQAEFGQSGIPDSGKVLAAELIHGKTLEKIVLHEKDSGETLYLTPSGNFFESVFITTPVKSFKRISSKFATSRRHPILDRNRSHKGLDYAARLGAEVRAVADGKIIMKNFSSSLGNVIAIAHSNNIETRYGHLLKFGPNLKLGCQVKKGQVIGNVGMTGLATGPHLHFEFLVNGEQVDPRKMSEMNSALSGSEKSEFAQTTSKYLKALEEFKASEKL